MVKITDYSEVLDSLAEADKFFTDESDCGSLYDDHLRKTVLTYNNKHNTSFDPQEALYQYKFDSSVIKRVKQKNNKPKLKNNYQSPSVPKGFDQPSCFHYPDGDVTLDFVNHERRDFASETMKVKIEWPWIDGYKPTDKDWGSINFFALYA